MEGNVKICWGLHLPGTCHTRERGYPEILFEMLFWIPACAGMTNITKCRTKLT